ncbi:MAG: Gfo/Idh/MocA family oxidoreductase [Armatimonadota bacterium]|nr:Gfo/Idh/MocA family oxidoreductase [Armatimonadota bacterium]
MPAEDPVGVALIGTGMWGRRLAAALRRTPALHLVCCYGRDEARRRAFAAEFRCEVAPSFEAAVDHPQVEGVLLVTPNYVHREQALACAERRRHVFVEKPIADTLTEGREMAAACRAAGVTLFVGHQMRRLGAARRVKALLDEGVLGRVVLAEANFSLPGVLSPDQWRAHRRTCPGGPLMQLGIHHADTLQYLLGPVVRVRGSFARLATAAEIDDVGVAALEFAAGTQGTLTSSYVSPKTYSLRLYGTAAVLDYQTEMAVWPDVQKLDPATALTLRTEAGLVPVTFTPRDPLVEELEEFARCVRGAAQPETGAAEALAALQVIVAAVRSHELGAAVAVTG